MRVWKLGKRVPLRRFHLRLNCEPKPDVSTVLSANEITSSGSTKPTVVSLSRDIHTNNYLLAESDLVSIKSGYGFQIGISTTGRLFGRGVNSHGQLSAQVDSNGKNIGLYFNITRHNLSKKPSQHKTAAQSEMLKYT